MRLPIHPLAPTTPTNNCRCFVVVSTAVVVVVVVLDGVVVVVVVVLLLVVVDSGWTIWTAA